MAKFYLLSYLIIELFSVATFAESCNSAPAIHQVTKEIIQCAQEAQPVCLKNEGFEDKSIPPEAILKIKLEKISDEETVIRLIFSEILATHCLDKLSEHNLKIIGSGIAAVINHRLLKMNSKSAVGANGKTVVLAKEQFRSSTGDCDVAKREEFLCPTKDPQWAKLWRVAQNSWENIKQKDPLDAKTVFYYFPKHFDGSKNCERYSSPEVFEKWKKGKTEVPIENSNKELNECVRFFK